MLGVEQVRKHTLGRSGSFLQARPTLTIVAAHRTSAAFAAEWKKTQEFDNLCICSTSGADDNVIKLRLRRMGKKKRPSYRIVAAEVTSPRDGRFIETLGHYDPLTEPATIKINSERALHWLSVGAQPTETVAGLLKRAGVTGGDAVAESKA